MGTASGGKDRKADLQSQRHLLSLWIVKWPGNANVYGLATGYSSSKEHASG